MSSSPIDDVQGHAWRHGQDPEAVDEDQVAGDTQGHSAKTNHLDPEAADDTEGHSARANRMDAETVDEDQVGDDVEGHGRKWRL